MKESKILIAFFSRSGANFANGSIVNLKLGNTEIAAHMINKLTGGDLFKIDRVQPYPDDYTATSNEAKKELRQNARPVLKEKPATIDGYDTVILGYPNWWGTMPMVVHTFLESFDFSEKTILPLCTHEGSGMGRRARDMVRLCPGARVLSGLPIVGSNIQHAGNDIEVWLRKHGVIEY